MTPDLATNVLYNGDNLDILRRYLPDTSVDLTYLDPPFSSNRDSNVIFKDESGNPTDAQLLAFEDTWHWDPSDEETRQSAELLVFANNRADRRLSTRRERGSQ